MQANEQIPRFQQKQNALLSNSSKVKIERHIVKEMCKKQKTLDKRQEL